MSTPQLFGWIPPQIRSRQQHEAHERAMASAAMLPSLSLNGYREEKGRFPLWEFAKRVNGGSHIPFFWQLTGSCVGAGGGNMLRILQCVEICGGDLEEFRPIWWPFTYGQSRLRGGMRTPGEGSFGSTWAEAIAQDGILAIDEATGLPPFKDVQGWWQLTSALELAWSDGDGRECEAVRSLAKVHLVKSVVQIKNADEAKAVIAGAKCPITIASNFGTRGPRLRGNPPVMVAEWDDTWPHQMSLNEAWDHDTEGLIFHDQNNWGPDAHPAPTQGEPPGGFYITAKTLDRICAAGETFAFSMFDGFKVRELDWYI